MTIGNREERGQSRSVRIDPVVTENITAVSDDETLLQVAGFDNRDHMKAKRRLRRNMQRQCDAGSNHVLKPAVESPWQGPSSVSED